ncbi:NepR family anti-sigma factor [Hellea balneolensis]|uniref:NepR family anti-sigma factor n=1 Tax=Hellea balneolensis TaxID=287478 RepID=UPI00040D8CA2|nr:NepR family anti-sigma factor [Hellea balneolensis]
MTQKNTPKSSKRDDLGDVFTDEDLPEKIGKNLRQIYDDVLNEPVPDDFLSLLSKADNKSG